MSEVITRMNGCRMNLRRSRSMIASIRPPASRRYGIGRHGLLGRWGGLQRFYQDLLGAGAVPLRDADAGLADVESHSVGETNGHGLLHAERLNATGEVDRAPLGHTRRRAGGDIDWNCDGSDRHVSGHHYRS